MLQLAEYLEMNGLLSDKQFEFRKGRHVEDQLLLTYAEVADKADSGLVVIFLRPSMLLVIPLFWLSFRCLVLVVSFFCGFVYFCWLYNWLYNV